jgi:hypothetical protein
MMKPATAHRSYRLHHSGIELHVAEIPALTNPFAFRVADMIADLPDATEAESANARFICGD